MLDEGPWEELPLPLEPDPVAELAERVAAASAKRIEVAVEKALQLGDRGVAVYRVNGVAVTALPDRQVPYGHVYEFTVPPWKQVV